MNRRAMIIHSLDNVANLIGPGARGDVVQCITEGQSETESIALGEDIPANQKFARVDIKAGDPVTKYGLNIGRASRDIRKGQHVHIHNIESNRGRGDLNQ